MQNISEKILYRLSKKASANQRFNEGDDMGWSYDNPLSILEEAFPRFTERIKDKVILDFGCGWGHQARALVHAGAKFVMGLETNEKSLSTSKTLAIGKDWSQQVRFTNYLPPEYRGAFDMVISQNAMEHFQDPLSVLEIMKSALKNDGQVLITFGPPWYAPYGSHMQFFTDLPWINILFPEAAVMNVRAKFRPDGAKRYEDVESGLNKMTVAKFEKIIQKAGLKIAYHRYDCVKKLNFLARVPILRELFINQVSCMLEKNSLANVDKL